MRAPTVEPSGRDPLNDLRTSMQTLTNASRASSTDDVTDLSTAVNEKEDVEI